MAVSTLVLVFAVRFALAQDSSRESVLSQDAYRIDEISGFFDSSDEPV